MTRTPVLVLNHSYIPIHITTVRRSFILLYQGLAKAVDHKFDTFDFENWCSLEASDREEDAIGLVNRRIRIPRVIILMEYNNIPKRHLRFSRHHIFIRDAYICQFCNKQFSTSDLNLDHVIPKSQGGKTLWENVVTSCIPCNRKKGGLSLREAGMKLVRKPVRPHWTPFTDFSRGAHHEEWKPFMRLVTSH